MEQQINIAEPLQSEEPATRARRFATLIIDLLFLSFLLACIQLVQALMWLWHWHGDYDIGKAIEETYNLPAVFATVFLYYFLCEFLSGKTVGKVFTGTKVQCTDGSSLDIFHTATRTLFRFIPFEFFSFMGNIHPNGWHDRLSHTRVVIARKSIITGRIIRNSVFFILIAVLLHSQTMYFIGNFFILRNNYKTYGQFFVNYQYSINYHHKNSTEENEGSYAMPVGSEFLLKSLLEFKQDLFKTAEDRIYAKYVNDKGATLWVVTNGVYFFPSADNTDPLNKFFKQHNIADEYDAYLYMITHDESIGFFDTNDTISGKWFLHNAKSTLIGGPSSRITIYKGTKALFFHGADNNRPKAIIWNADCTKSFTIMIDGEKDAMTENELDFILQNSSFL